jgi:adenosine deaminase CECR1
MVNASYLLTLSLKQPNMYIRIPSKLTASTLTSVLPEFRGLPPSASETFTATTITGPDGKIEEWVNLRHARENFSIALGGPEGFDAWVLGALMINPAEAYGTHNTVDKVRGQRFAMLYGG